MVCRVAFVGHPDWLESERVREVRGNRRVACVATETLDSLGADCFNTHADVLLLHFVDAFDCCVAAVQRSFRCGNGVRCVAVAGHTVDADVGRIVAAGSWGLLLESASPSTYCDAISRVAVGRLAYPSDVLNRISSSGGHMTLLPKTSEGVDRLTAEEQSLVRLLADGLTTNVAAHALGMTPQAAQRLRRNLMTRLNLPNRAMLVRYAIRAGLVEL